MEYVLDENGNIKIGPNGQPLVKDGSKEFEIDAIGANEKIATLNTEAKGYRQKAAGYKTDLEAFGDLDPTKAKEALTTVAGLDENQKVLIDKTKAEITESFQGKIDGLEASNKSLQDVNFNLQVTSKFATTGELKRTLLTPDIASAFFGQNFVVKDGAVVGMNGEKEIYSKTKLGEIAGFDEALAIMIDSYPNKDDILKGSGGHGRGDGDGDGDGQGGDKTAIENIAAGLKNRN